MVLRRLKLVDAAPDPVVKKKKNRKHRYRKRKKDQFGTMMRKRSWITDYCFRTGFCVCIFNLLFYQLFFIGNFRNLQIGCVLSFPFPVLICTTLTNNRLQQILSTIPSSHDKVGYHHR